MSGGEEYRCCEAAGLRRDIGRRCLTARPARDIRTLADQLATREWWQSAPTRFDLVVSRFVLDEAGAGDPTAACDQLAALATLRILASNAESAELGRRLVQSHALPSEAA